ncbi:hypothetical protein HK096_010794, partial [Nowakowskiella sp. JEL0078]
TELMIQLSCTCMVGEAQSGRVSEGEPLRTNYSVSDMQIFLYTNPTEMASNMDFYTSTELLPNSRRRGSRRQLYDYDDYRDVDYYPPTRRSRSQRARDVDDNLPRQRNHSRSQREQDSVDQFLHRAVMKKGILQYKKVVGISKRLVVLIAPDTVQDILDIHRILFKEDPVNASNNQKTIYLLGQISTSA